MKISANGAITPEILENAAKIASENFGNYCADVFLVNPRQWARMQTYMKRQNQLNRMTPWRRRQEELKDDIQQRLGTHKKRNLPL